jgi:flagellar protein FlbD
VITLHKLTGEPVVLNAELIETIEATPDTVITLVDRRRVIVAEEVGDIVQRVVDYRRAVLGASLLPTVTAALAAQA